MKALVTGATGFIGSHLAETLVRRDYEVTCLVRKTSDLRWIRHLPVDFLYADLETVGSYAEQLGQFDYVFHAAGLTKAESEKAFFHGNAECTRILATAAAGANPGLKRFLLVSSLAAAGPSFDGTPLTEEADPRPVSAYGRSKLEGEKAAMACGGKIPVTVVRPPAVYGPRDRDFLLVFKAAQKGFFPYWGKCFYSLIHVGDLVNGLILAAEKNEAAGRTYYLADRIVHSNDDIRRALSAAYGRNAFRLRLPRSILPVLAVILQKFRKKGIINADKIREIRFPHWTCDPERAVKELGFCTGTPLGEGFMITADWYRKEKWL